jgi:hypothetical protein
MKTKILVLALMAGLTASAMAQSGGLPVQNQKLSPQTLSPQALSPPTLSRQTLSPQNLSSNNLNYSATNGLNGTNGAANGNGLNGMTNVNKYNPYANYTNPNSTYINPNFTNVSAGSQYINPQLHQRQPRLPIHQSLRHALTKSSASALALPKSVGWPCSSNCASAPKASLSRRLMRLMAR